MKREDESSPRTFVGPLLWEQLPPAVEARARQLFYSCGKYVVPTFEQWEVGLCREESPEQELQIWSRIDRAFRSYFSGRQVTTDLAAEVVYDLMSISLDIKKSGLLYAELKRLYDVA